MITESDLIIPSLKILEFNEGGLTTSELSEKLRLAIEPSGDDLMILS